MQVLYLGRAPRTKETLPDFLKWRQVTRHPLVFRGLTGSQHTPGIGALHLYSCRIHVSLTHLYILHFLYFPCFMPITYGTSYACKV